MVKLSSLFILSILSGLLLGFSWPVNGFTPIIFIAFIPILLVEERISSSSSIVLKHLKVFQFSYLTFFLWNLIATWWVYNASLGGALLAMLFNSLFMALVFTLFHSVKARVETSGTFLLIPLWISFEFIHYHWDLAWPWLTLGNVFADDITWVQWYEYTGVFGGSLWVLLLNLILFRIIIHYTKYHDLKGQWSKVFTLLALIAVPLVLSRYMYENISDGDSDSAEIVIVQPNIDPYNEKFSGLTSEEQLSRMLNLASEKVNIKTDYLVMPETAIIEGLWENDPDQNFSISMLRNYQQNLPNLNILSGITSHKVYDQGEVPSITARKFRNQNLYYDEYNSAINLNSIGKLSIYHKSKLVPGVELMPFPGLLKPLEKLAINMGGTTGSLGMQKERSVFISKDGRIKAAPVICYESVFGKYVTDYVRNGANLIFIITNDGWWGDTPGYKQHLAYGRLRAIETRREIARSANTGISCFINKKGDVLFPTSWWVPAVISYRLELEEGKTFYVRYGDYIAQLSAIISVILLLTLIFKSPILNKLKIKSS